jgi:hypothetical protein
MYVTQTNVSNESIDVIRGLYFTICHILGTVNNVTYSVALQSLKDLGRLAYRRFLELFRHLVGLLGRVISPSQGLYLHRTTQHRNTRTNIHALNGNRTHDPSVVNSVTKPIFSSKIMSIEIVKYFRYPINYIWL